MMNAMVTLLWQYSRYWRNGSNLSSIMVTHNRGYTQVWCYVVQLCPVNACDIILLGNLTILVWKIMGVSYSLIPYICHAKLSRQVKYVIAELGIIRLCSPGYDKPWGIDMWEIFVLDIQTYHLLVLEFPVKESTEIAFCVIPSQKSIVY